MPIDPFSITEIKKNLLASKSQEKAVKLSGAGAIDPFRIPASGEASNDIDPFNVQNLPSSASNDIDPFSVDDNKEDKSIFDFVSDKDKLFLEERNKVRETKRNTDLARETAAKLRNETALISDEQADTTLGYIANTAVAGFAGAANVVGGTLNLGANVLDTLDNLHASPEEREMYASIQEKERTNEPLTPEETEFRSFEGVNGLEGAYQHLQNITRRAPLKNAINAGVAAVEKLVNDKDTSIAMEKLGKNSEKVVDDWGNGNYSKSIGKFFGGLKDLAVEDPGAAGTLLAQTVPHMVFMAKNALFGVASIGSSEYAQALEDFEEEHDRAPDDGERAIAAVLSYGSVGLDAIGAKAVLEGKDMVIGALAYANKANVAIAKKTKESAKSAFKRYKDVTSTTARETVKNSAKATAEAVVEVEKKAGLEVLKDAGIFAGTQIGKQALNVATSKPVKAGFEEGITETAQSIASQQASVQDFSKTDYAAAITEGTVGTTIGSSLSVAANSPKTLTRAAVLGAKGYQVGAKGFKEATAGIRERSAEAKRTVTNADPAKAEENIQSAVKSGKPGEVLSIITNVLKFDKMDAQQRHDNLTQANKSIDDIQARFEASTDAKERLELKALHDKYVPIIDGLIKDHSRRVDAEANIDPKAALEKIIKAKKDGDVDVKAEIEVILNSRQSSEFMSGSVTDALMNSEIFDEATPEQQAEIRAINDIAKTSEEVSSNIISGSEDGKYKGTTERLAVIQEAADTDNIESAVSTLDKMKSLLSDEEAKLLHINALLSNAERDESGQLIPVDIPASEQEYGVRFIAAPLENFANSVQKDVSHLVGAVARGTRILNTQFDTDPATAITPDGTPVTPAETATDSTAETIPTTPTTPVQEGAIATPADIDNPDSQANLEAAYGDQPGADSDVQEATTNIDDADVPSGTQTSTETGANTQTPAQSAQTTSTATNQGNSAQDSTKTETSTESTTPAQSDPIATDTGTNPTIAPFVENPAGSDGKPVSRATFYKENNIARTLDAREKSKNKKDYDAGVVAVNEILTSLRNLFGITEPIELATIIDVAGKQRNGAAAREQGIIALNTASYEAIGRAGRSLKGKKSNADDVVIAEAYETVYHEFGHILEHVLFNQADQKTKDAIEAEYQAWVKNEKRGSRQPTGKQVVNKDKQHPNPDYWLARHEWLADQVARYITTKQFSETADPLFTAFIKDVASKLKTLYGDFIAELQIAVPAAPVMPLAQFLDAHIESVRTGVPWDVDPVTPVTTKPEGDANYDFRALALKLAKERGRVSGISLSREAGISLEEALKIVGALKTEGLLDGNGDPIAKSETKPTKPTETAKPTKPAKPAETSETTTKATKPEPKSTKEALKEQLTAIIDYLEMVQKDGRLANIDGKISNLLVKIKAARNAGFIKTDAKKKNINRGYKEIVELFKATSPITAVTTATEAVTETTTETETVQPVEDGKPALGEALLNDTKIDGIRRITDVMQAGKKKIHGLFHSVSNLVTRISEDGIQELLGITNFVGNQEKAMANFAGFIGMFHSTVLGSEGIDPLLKLLSKSNDQGKADIVPTAANPKELQQQIDEIENKAKKEKRDLTTRETNLIAGYKEKITVRSASTWKPNRAGDLQKDPIGWFITFDKDGNRSINENLLSVIGTVAYNWLATEAESTLHNDDAVINGILQRNKSDDLQYWERNALYDKGSVRNALAHKLGAQIWAQLGLEIKSTTDGFMKSQLQHALGDLAITVMLQNDVLVQQEIQLGPYMKNNTDVKVSDYANTAKDFTRFIRPKTSSKGIYDTSQNTVYTLVMRDSKFIGEVLDKLLVDRAAPRKPSFTVPTFVPEFVRKSKQLIPSATRKVLEKMQSVPFSLKSNMLDIYQFMTKEDIEDMLGFTRNIVGKEHETRHPTVEGRNLGIEREMMHLDNFIEENGDNKFANIFFNYFVISSHRIMDDSNTINMQASKFHRHMFGAKAWEVEVNSEETRRVFKLAVALAFGVSVDNQPVDESLAMFDKFNNGNTKEGKKIKKAVKAIKAIQQAKKNKTVLSGEQTFAYQAAIKEAVMDTKGDPAHILDGLLALAAYDAKKAFTTNLAVETDGKTNGVVTGMLQSMLEENIEERLAAGAIFTDGTTDYGEYRKAGNLDAYEQLAQKWNALLDKVFNSNDAVKAKSVVAISGLLSKEVVAQELVAIIEREHAKNPLMISTYGAGVKKIVAQFSNVVLEKVYEKIAANMDNQAALDIISAQLTDMMGLEVKLVKGPALLAYRLPNEVGFKNKVIESYGAALSGAIESQFKQFTVYRKTLNLALNTAFKIFYREYEKRVAEAKAKNGGYNLTDVQLEKLAYDMQELMPIFKGPISEGIKDGLLAMKSVNKTLHQESSNTQQSYNGVIRNTNASSSTGHVKYRDFSAPGVAGLIQAIQSVDSGTIQGVLGDFDMLNMYDAGYYSILDVVGATEQINVVYGNLNKKYDLASEVLTTLNRSLAHIEGDLNAKSEINALMNADIKKKEDKLADPIATLLTDINNLNNMVTNAREEFYKNNPDARYNQYVFPGTSVTLSDKPSNTKKEANEETIAQKSSEVVQEVVAESKETTKNPTNPNDSGDLLFDEGFGSSDQDIDVDSFKDDVPEPSGPEYTLNIFDALAKLGNTTESTEHATYLRDLISNIVNRTLAPLALKRREAGAVTKGAIRGNTIYMETAEVNTIGNGFAMSAQETYTHELFHGVTRTAINEDFNLRNELENIYKAAKKVITWEDFIDKDVDGNPIYRTDQATEEAEAKNRFNYIFNNGVVTETSRIDSLSRHKVVSRHHASLHEFMAYGMTNEKVISILGGVTIQPDRKSQPNTIFRYLEDLFNRVLDFVTGRVYRSKSVTADKALAELADRMTSVHEANRSALLQMVSNVDLNGAALKALDVAIFSPAKRLHQFTRDSDNYVGMTYHTVSGLFIHAKSKAFHNVVKTIARNIGLAELGLLTSTVREMMGTTKVNAVYHQLLTMSKKYVDQARTQLEQQVAAQIMKNFLSDVPISKDESAGILRALMETDAVVLIDDFGFNGIMEMLRDESALQTAIKNTEQLLAGDPNYGYYRNQADGLGQLMATGETTVADQRQSVSMIAHLTGVTTRETLPEDSASSQMEIIERLASLYAIEYTNDFYRNKAADVMQRESDINADDNGILFTLGLHKAFKEDSKSDLFDNNPNQMIKGYTSEIFDPSVAVKVVSVLPTKAENEKQAKLLKIQNYKLMDVLEKDPKDPHSEKQELWVSKDSLKNSRVKGIFSLTNQNLRGFTLEDYYINKKIKGAPLKAIIARDKVVKNNAQEVERQFTDARMSRKSTNKRIVPINDGNGRTTGYRYMMSKSNKVGLLKKTENFSMVMGRMYGNKKDKVNSPKVNRQTLLKAFQDYQANVGENPNDFVYIGKDSTDPEMKELYDLLPKQAKRDMKNIWNNDGMYFRESVVRTAFGFRKWSIAETAEYPMVSPLLNAMRGKGAYVHITKTLETIWQEFVDLAKDYIVIKLYTTVMNNGISNTILLGMKGVPPNKIFEYQIRAYKALDKYLAEEQKMNDLKRKLRVSTHLNQKQKEAMQHDIAYLEGNLTASPVKKLLDEGVFQTISAEELNIGEDPYSTRGKLLDYVEPVTSKIPQPIKTAYDWTYMTHKSPPYKLMLKLTQYSDFIARYTLYTHRMEKMNPKTKEEHDQAHEVNLALIKETFVNYDDPTHKALQYGNDNGLFLFTKFPLRITKVALTTFAEKPVSHAGLFAYEHLFGDVSYITDSINPLDWIGKGNNPFDILDSATDAGLLTIADDALEAVGINL